MTGTGAPEKPQTDITFSIYACAYIKIEIDIDTNIDRYVCLYKFVCEIQAKK